MATKPPSGVANGAFSEASDLSAMWAKAVEDYEKKTKKSLRLASGRSMAEVMASTEVETNNFNNFRHSGSNVDKVRTAFKNNLGIIQKVVSGIEILGAAASVSFLSRVNLDRVRINDWMSRRFRRPCLQA
jgi:hypothetical protein